MRGFGRPRHVYHWQGREGPAERMAAEALAADPGIADGRALYHAVRAVMRPSTEISAGWSDDSDENTNFWQAPRRVRACGVGRARLRQRRPSRGIGPGPRCDPHWWRGRTHLGDGGLSADRSGWGEAAHAGHGPGTNRGNLSGARQLAAGHALRRERGLRAIPVRRDRVPHGTRPERRASETGFDVTPSLDWRYTGAPGRPGSAMAITGPRPRPASRSGSAAACSWVRTGEPCPTTKRAWATSRRTGSACSRRVAGYNLDAGAWDGRFSGGLGGQQIGRGGSSQSEWHLDARLSRRWGTGNRVEAFGGLTNSAVSSTTGAFRFGTAGVSVRVGL